MRLKLKEHLELPDEKNISESLVGKGFAIGQQRHHQANKTKLISVISRIQNTAKNAANENEPEKR